MVRGQLCLGTWLASEVRDIAREVIDRREHLVTLGVDKRHKEASQLTRVQKGASGSGLRVMERLSHWK